LTAKLNAQAQKAQLFVTNLHNVINTKEITGGCQASEPLKYHHGSVTLLDSSQTSVYLITGMHWA
jgi:hypothetical protein